jgi:mono/diheme cytochrome c family protein
MMRTNLILAILAAGLAAGSTGGASWVAAQQQTAAPQAESSPAPSSDSSIAPAGGSGNARTTSPRVAAAPVRSDAEDRIEGEKRFRANCARCHQAPHKFSPRATATIVRHMRVRATLTDEDARLILKYMTQ